jgi:hypothetical protein
MRTKSAGPAGSQPMNAPSPTPVVGAITRRTLGLSGLMCPKGELAREKNVSDHADQLPDSTARVIVTLSWGLSICIPSCRGN